MPRYAVVPPEITSISIAGRDDRFPVRRVFCVGRNYAEHAREMGGDPDKEPPFFFQKPADAVIEATGVVPYPPLTSDFQFEIEMVIAIGEEGFDVTREQALTHVWGYAVGVDLTRRDLQAEAKAQRRPWDWAKAFDASAPITQLRPVSQIGHPSTGRIWLAVNGEAKQESNLSAMVWPVPDVVRYVSQSIVLKPGDIIFSGTPAGVGPLRPGDVVSGGVEGLAEFEFRVGPKLASAVATGPGE
ncbi:fumarylacetoacetate hydrolase family protein [Caballeronia grimmiae]|uniref:Fumarylacetoacetate hydrolase n=1 Tax=Caballeronia grimmiae TaxID=1071679 RepID=A0A069NC19_9BURK|nr:fumarylacetoacetate hydrolase family protein [Caballeronia grimmiae]KDR25637.1 fumarylacetoacetate hydrolase [Caballeronia grimmiae]GGD98043.1 fumarylpyruvate hydrolase [Caballeronia grimmiae]